MVRKIDRKDWMERGSKRQWIHTKNRIKPMGNRAEKTGPHAGGKRWSSSRTGKGGEELDGMDGAPWPLGGWYVKKQKTDRRE